MRCNVMFIFHYYITVHCIALPLHYITLHHICDDSETKSYDSEATSHDSEANGYDSEATSNESEEKRDDSE